MTDLHIVRLVLDRRALLRAVRSGRRPIMDEGYLLHAGLSALFATSPDERAKVPLHTFAVDDTLPATRQRPDSVYLLAYSDLDEGALTDRMAGELRGMVRQCATRDVPEVTAGTHASFRVRACPVVRTRQAPPGEDRAEAGRARSREVDAWLAYRFARWEEQPPLREDHPFERGGVEWSERERVYGEWLGRELGRGGAASLAQPATLAQFQRVKLHRRGGKSRKSPERPDVVLQGSLRVDDAGAFRAVLRRGVGRHRAFGFGMLLLRRE